MANKEFQVRHGLVVNNNVLVANTITGNVGIGTSSPSYTLDVFGTINAANILMNGGTISAAANLAPAFNTANAAYTTANAAFVAANSANLLAYNTGIGANAWANTVGTAGNNYSNSTFVKLTAPSQTITGDFNITGNLFIGGNTTSISANNLVVNDSLIYLANNNQADILDIGFIGSYKNATSAHVHTGLYREHASKQYYLFQGFDADPELINDIAPYANNMVNATLIADFSTSNLTLGGANAITWIRSGFDVANAAYGQANTLATSANAKVSSVTGTAGQIFSSGGTTPTLNLISSGVTATTYGGSSNIPVVTVDAFGRITSASNVAFSSGTGTVTSVIAGTGLSGGTITSTGTISMPNVGPGSGSYSSGISAITLDAQGRITAITGSAGYLTGITSGQVTGALGYTPYNSTNPSGYITSSALSPYAPLAGATFTGLITGKVPSTSGVGAGNDAGSMSIRGDVSNSAHFSFHRAGAYAINMGLDTDNVFRIGGWSDGATTYRLQLATPGGTSTLNGILVATTDMRAPIFYDQNNTGYYVNPDGTSNILKLITSSRIVLPSSNDGRTNGLWHWGDADSNWVTYMAQPTVGTNPAGTTMTAGYWGNGHTIRVRGGNWSYENHSDNTLRAHIDGTGAYFAGQTRSPIFYDSDNTSYYLNPADVSYLVEPRMAWRSLIGNQSYDGTLYDGGYEYRPGITIRGNYPHLNLVSSGINNTSHGPTLRFMAYDTASATSGNYKHWVVGCAGTNATRLSIGYASNNSNPHEGIYGWGTSAMWFENDSNVYCNASIRPTIMYDRNNTNYYCDPDGTNRLNFVNSNNHYIQPGYMLYSDHGSWQGEYNKIQWHSTHLYLQNNGGGYLMILRRGDGGERFWVDYNGNMVASGNVSAYSDARLKENIKTITDALGIINKLRGVTFSWIKTQEPSYGLIAQEVEKVIPELVMESENGTAEGDMKTTVKSVDYSKIVSILIEGMKEQQKMLDLIMKKLDIVI